MGNCVYYVPPHLLAATASESLELTAYTHALYDARGALAIERLQDEAEALAATGIVGVTVAERQHSWRTNPSRSRERRAHDGRGDRALVVGTAVVPMGGGAGGLSRPVLVLSANDPSAAAAEGE